MGLTVGESLSARMTLDNRDFVRGLSNSERQTDRSARAMRLKLLGTAAAAAGVVSAIKLIGASSRFLRSSITGFQQQQDAVATLRASLIATGRDGDVSLQLLTKRASELQAVTKAGDEATIKATASFAALAEGLNANELAKAQEAIIGIADTFTRGDLDSAAQLLGKSIGSTTNALTRYGIQVDTSATQSEKLAQVLAQTDKFFQISQAQADTLSGRLVQLSNAWGDLKEAIGEVVAGSPLVKSFIEQTTKVIGELTTLIQAGAPFVKEGFELLGDIAVQSFVGALAKGFERVASTKVLGIQLFGKLFTERAAEAADQAVIKIADRFKDIEALSRRAAQTIEDSVVSGLGAGSAGGNGPAASGVGSAAAGGRSQGRLNVLLAPDKLGGLIGSLGKVKAESTQVGKVANLTGKAFQEWRERVIETGAQIVDVVSPQLDRVATGVADIVTGFRSAADTIKMVGKAILRDIVQGLVKAILKATILKGLLSAFLGPASGLIPFKRGGMISARHGVSLPGTVPAAFGRSGGIPILAHPGEAVLTREAVNRLGGPRAVNRVNTASRSITSGSTGAGVSSVNVARLELSFPNVRDVDQIKRELPAMLRDLRRKGAI